MQFATQINAQPVNQEPHLDTLLSFPDQRFNDFITEDIATN